MSFKYFNCFNVIPSRPLLVFAGNLSIILITLHLFLGIEKSSEFPVR